MSGHQIVVSFKQHGSNHEKTRVGRMEIAQRPTETLWRAGFYVYGWGSSREYIINDPRLDSQEWRDALNTFGYENGARLVHVTIFEGAAS